MKNSEFETKLKEFRKQLDNVDEKIIELISDRFKITNQIGHLKAEYKKKALDSGREQEILKKLAEKYKEHSLDTNMLKDIWTILMYYSKKEQKDILIKK